MLKTWRLSTSTKCRWFSSAVKQISLKKPTIDVRAIRNNPELYQDSIDRRRVRLPQNMRIADILKQADEVNSLNKERNDLVFRRKQIQKSMKSSADEATRSELVELKSQIKNREIMALEKSIELDAALEAIPNLLSEDSFIDKHQLVGMIHGDRKKEASADLDHHKIATKLGIVDFASASSVSGTSSYYLVGDGALLENALVQYALSRARKAGWKFLTPPSLVRQEFTNACGFRPRDNNNEQQVYMIEGSDLCLTGTAEIPLAGWAANKVLDLRQPIRKVGVSRSYRAEAGSRGKDTKGLYRVHEFTKVELFAWAATSAEARDILEEILQFQKSMVEDLGICARILNMPPDDLGNPAYKKYDIESWMPGRGDWGETSSTSNCLDFQSRRLNTKFKDTDGSLKYAQTLNGTAVAVPRMMVAILENYYDVVNNRVEVPRVLRQWMDGQEYIEAQT